MNTEKSYMRLAKSWQRLRVSFGFHGKFQDNVLCRQ